jgi:hypothetical protein
MQRTESNELGAESDRSGGPTLLPQVIEQRKALFQFFDILTHGGVLPLDANVGEGRQHSQARMVGRRKFLRAARAKEFAKPESAKAKAQLGFSATGAAAATDANPVVMLIVRLLAAASVADDRIVFASRASPQNDLGTARGPIRFELVRWGRKWDKQNRTSWSSAPALTREDLSRKRSSSS